EERPPGGHIGQLLALGAAIARPARRPDAVEHPLRHFERGEVTEKPAVAATLEGGIHKPARREAVIAGGGGGGAGERRHHEWAQDGASEGGAVIGVSAAGADASICSNSS